MKTSHLLPQPQKIAMGARGHATALRPPQMFSAPLACIQRDVYRRCGRRERAFCRGVCSDRVPLFHQQGRLCVQRKKSPVVALRLCMPRRSGVSRGAETSIGEVRCGQGFFSTDEWILENAHRITHIPTIIVQGR